MPLDPDSPAGRGGASTLLMELKAQAAKARKSSGLSSSASGVDVVSALRDAAPGSSAHEELKSTLQHPVEDYFKPQPGLVDVVEKTGGPAIGGVSEEALDGLRTRDPFAVPESRDEQKEEKEALADLLDDRWLREGMEEGRGKKTKELTTEKYLSLNSDQKAAVDLNTMLIEAVQADKRLRNQGGKTEGDASYDEQVEELFGEQDWAPFSPHTINLLDKVNYVDHGAKINDFLKLKVAFTPADIKALDPLPKEDDPATSTVSVLNERHGLQADLVQDLKTTRKDGADGSALLEIQRQALGTDRIMGVNSGEPEWDQFFQEGLNALAKPENAPDRPKIMETIKSELSAYDPKGWEKFLTFLDVTTREAKQYGLPLGSAEGVTYYNPKEFRAQLGLNG